MSKFFLCCARSLNQQIDELNKAGKKGKVAAKCCLEVLEKIRKEAPSSGFLENKRTKNGEARVEKCIKYDLGNGYRLITIRSRDHLFIPFAGTHDKADLWLEHNRLDNIHKKKQLYSIEKISPDAQTDGTVFKASSETAAPDEYEENLFNRIDDNILRQVFRGLVEQR